MKDKANPYLLSLLVEASTGNSASFTKFYELTYKFVASYLMKFHHLSNIEDLLQQVYLRLWTSLHHFDQSSSPTSWLFMIAHRVSVDAIRKTYSEGFPIHGDFDALSVPNQELSVDIMLLLDALSTNAREALILTALFGFSYEESAKICGCPVGTIKSRVHSARQKLAAMIDDNSGGVIEGTAG